LKKIVLYSEGSASSDLASGGYGTILLYSKKERLLRGSVMNTTANRMELQAVIEGLRALKEPCAITIITSSAYVVKGIKEWLELWVKRDFTKVKNLDLWQEYYTLAQSHSVEATLVVSPIVNSTNERCYQMVQEEIQNA
jgi:ribonuclease HI